MLGLSGPNALLFLQLLISLTTSSAMNDCAISNDFLLVSLVTSRVSPEELFLPSFDVLNCWLNLIESCLDDENEHPLKVLASFSASRFALTSIPLIVLHSLVTSVFWSKVSTKALHFLFCVGGGEVGDDGDCCVIRADQGSQITYLLLRYSV